MTITSVKRKLANVYYLQKQSNERIVEKFKLFPNRNSWYHSSRRAFCRCFFFLFLYHIFNEL